MTATQHDVSLQKNVYELLTAMGPGISASKFLTLSTAPEVAATDRWSHPHSPSVCPASKRPHLRLYHQIELEV